MRFPPPRDGVASRLQPLRRLLRRTRHLLLVASLVAAVATTVAASGCSRSVTSAESEAIPGARLGMSPRDVRERFQSGGEGSWQTTVGTGDDTTLEWRAKDASARFATARFEFHLGMLVAVRARLRESTTGENIALTPKTVTVRRPAEGEAGTDITLLARDCPTHREEADALAAKAH
jgi:hypothetical protein